MGITRALPKTDVARNIAQKTAKLKKDVTAPANVPMTGGTQTRLDAQQPAFALKMNERSIALRAQTNSTMLKTAQQDKTKMFISHYFQAFNNGVARGVFSASDRAFYGLDVNSQSVPPLDKEALIVYWGERLITGDAARIAAGGVPMSNPNTSEVAAEYDSFVAINLSQSNFKDAFDTAQEAVGAMRPETDKLILRIWDEVEAAYNDETIESKRRKAREWGVFYQSTQKATITGVVTDMETSAPLTGVSVALIETEDIVLTDTEGKFTLVTSHFGTGTLEFALIGCVTQTIPVEVPEGGALTQDVQMKKL